MIGPAGDTFQPQVVGPASIPRVTSPQGESVVLAMLEGLEVLHDDTAKLYYDLVMSRLTEATRQALEDAMNQGGYEYQSEFARKYVAQGLAEGRTEGLAEGLAEGKAQEACRLVLRLLARRFGLLGQELQARVEGLDLERLESLADALLDFGSVADLQAWLTAH